MTKRQIKYWDDRMLVLEHAVVRRYRQLTSEVPDGSFMRRAFKAGYDVAKREQQKENSDGN
jgi:hypothetical protein